MVVAPNPRIRTPPGTSRVVQCGQVSLDRLPAAGRPGAQSMLKLVPQADRLPEACFRCWQGEPGAGDPTPPVQTLTLGEVEFTK